MSEKQWAEIWSDFKSNLQTITSMPPAEPIPTASFCRESRHLMLGHLTACQAAWLPILRGLNKGSEHVNVEHPNALYAAKGLGNIPWQELLAAFTQDRTEWQMLVESVDPLRPIKTQTKSYTSRQLTRRLVLHESQHLAESMISKESDTFEKHLSNEI